MRIILFFLFLAIIFSGGTIVLWYLIGHRIFVPLARALKFKEEDIDKTLDKVDKIFGMNNGKKTKTKKATSGKAKKKD